jgi:hypothetical protein
MTTQDPKDINQDESTIAEEIEAIVENVTDDTENL